MKYSDTPPRSKMLTTTSRRGRYCKASQLVMYAGTSTAAEMKQLINGSAWSRDVFRDKPK